MSSVVVTVSIGLAEASDVDSPRGMLAAADEAMYDAKDKGRNRVEFFRPDPSTYGMRVTTRQVHGDSTLRRRYTG